MLFKSLLLALAYITASNIAAPIFRREVPQEHSHENILILMRDAIALGSNPQNIGDPVFGLLGDAAAAGGLGDTSDVECLQQNTADLAFTNAKTSGNVTLMTAALVYRALERNTGSVGLQSNACTSTTATNPEIAAISQHQDPASTGAAATNKAIVLTLAQQIASIGGDPLQALQSGTFAPGTIGDPTAAGNTCDNIVNEGCINADNKLVDDATSAEIEAAVSGKASGATATVTAAAKVATNSVDAASCPAPVTVTVTGAATAAASSTPSPGQNLQTFSGNLGGSLPPAVTAGGRGFVVAGQTGDSFVNLSAALQRSCSVQNNACADAANSGAAQGVSVGDCNAQETQCNAA
ncbi:hypothetical protein BDP27DRAFT_1311238 [Rhodocollybia butyracea]|uniref:Uncharacterized protein n=1 Tax=Rhodocollybia butyracea TaxID=206335 RepID=A0A9P5UER5_9AGAR|nr:hypothetical protein BDP27DRAFT_1311238 [Rhodocollybia butyracea]